MAAPVAIARTAVAAARFLFTADENGETGARKLVIGITIGVFIFILIFSVAIELFILPMNALTEFFMPDSIVEAKHMLEADFGRPIISTGQTGLLPLPVTDTNISSMYGMRYVSIRGGWNFHEGIDFPVAFGSPVMAVAPGTVVGCGVSKDYGDYIMIEHHMVRYDEYDEFIEEETFYSFYAHLYKRYAFMGQRIEQGRQIALSGGDPLKHFAGNSTGAHLHLELRRTQAYETHFDPYDYVLDPNPFSGETKSIGWK